jgi:hypothetical protein
MSLWQNTVTWNGRELTSVSIMFGHWISSDSLYSGRGFDRSPPLSPPQLSSWKPFSPPKKSCS